MARHWRIRHKLNLGLATAMAVLALLLAGTINGLWSDYVAMKNMGSKLNELDVAEKLKTAVANLTLPKAKIKQRSSTNKPHSGDALYELEKKTKTAQRVLSEFELAVHETLNRKLTSDDGTFVQGHIDALRDKLNVLLGLCQETLKVGAKMTGGPLEEVDPQVRQKIQAEIVYIEKASDDIRSVVREGLDRQIKVSKDHGKLTMVVLISVSVLCVILLLCTLRYFYNWIYNPIRDLQQGVQKVAGGKFDHRIDVNSSDEMEELAKAFNDMSHRLNELYTDLEHQVNERSRQLVRSERLASVGFLAAGVAHEINNPLASIAFCSEALDARIDELQTKLSQAGKTGSDFEIFTKYLRMIQEEAFRCKNITERLLEFSRGGERKRERTDLVELIRSVIDVAEVHQNCKGKNIEFNPARHIMAWVNVDEIKSVVLNLVVNALDSMEQGGQLHIRLEERGGMAELKFSDTGCGMDEEVLENIFEPFFTQNRSGKGTGLGLTITHRIISQHGGEIEASSLGPGKGSTFHVRVPLQPPEPLKEEALDNAAA